MKFDLNVLKRLYEENTNLMEYMRFQSERENNTAEAIMLLYDFQAGSYIENYYAAPDKKRAFVQKLMRIIIEKNISGSLLEAGVGEATSLVPLLNLLAVQGEGKRFSNVFAFDISWSRIKIAKQFCADEGQRNIHLFTGNLLNIPLLDNSFDLVYTCHAIEPNGGKERDILQELYRVCRRYLILLEPCYEFASEEARGRMIKHGYVTRLYETAKELNYIIELYELYGVLTNPLNPTGIMIIKKHPYAETPQSYSEFYACPVSKKPIVRFADSFYCLDSMLAYPVIQDIPCLLPDDAVVATQYLKHR